MYRVIHAKPKPVAFAIAISRFRCSTDLEEYSGTSILLKQVCELGRRLSSLLLSLTMLKLRDLSPLTGARSLPVEN